MEVEKMKHTTAWLQGPCSNGGENTVSDGILRGFKGLVTSNDQPFANGNEKQQRTFVTKVRLQG